MNFQPDDSGYYLNPTQKSTNIETPPPLPAKPPQTSTTPSPTLNQTDLDKLKGLYNFLILIF